MLIYAEGQTKAQEDMAQEILNLICIAYPGHPWGVYISGDDKGGVVSIAHFEYDGPYRMNIRHSDKDVSWYSSSAFRKTLIMKVGEFLERCGLARGRWNEDPIKRVEGVPEKWQPAEYREEKRVAEIAVSPGELRDKPWRENGAN